MKPDRGIALVATLFLSLGVALLAATLFVVSHLDGWMAANQVAGERALYAADAGVEHALAVVPPAPDFAAEAGWLAAGLPFGPVVDFPRAPVSYRVTVVAAAADRLRIRSAGTAFRGAERRIEATLCRDRAVPPAALVLAAATVIGPVAGEVALDGADADGIVADRPRLAIESTAEAGAAIALDPEPRLLPVGSGLRAARTTLAGSADRTVGGPIGSEVLGSDAAPQVVRLVTRAEIDGSSSANGILLAEAPLRVRGRLEVDGVLLASAGLEVEGELVVRGAAFVEERIELAAGSRIDVAPSSAAVEVADDLRPGVLPRPAVLCGWRELW